MSKIQLIHIPHQGQNWNDALEGIALDIEQIGDFLKKNRDKEGIESARTELYRLAEIIRGGKQ